MEEKKNSNYFLLICLIIIVAMGVGIYHLYEKIEEVSTSQSQINVETKLEEISIEEDLVKKLYGYILQSDDFDHAFAWQNSLEPTSFYRKEKTTYLNLSDIEKTLVILKNYTNNEIKTINKSKLTNIIDTTHIRDDVKVYENINEKATEIFNQESDKWNDYVGCAGVVEYRNGNYYLSRFDGGGKGTSEVGYAKMQKAEKEEDYIYIYDKFVYIDSTNYDIGYGDSKVHIYTTSDKANELGTENEGIWSSNTIIDEIYKKYEEQLKIFKHTFKKTENGNYYWVSSEMYE